MDQSILDTFIPKKIYFFNSNKSAIADWADSKTRNVYVTSPQGLNFYIKVTEALFNIKGWTNDKYIPNKVFCIFNISSSL